MKKLYYLVGCLAISVWLTVPMGVTRGDDKPAEQDRLAPLARFEGEWTIDGHWKTGEELHARTIYEWGLGKKILKTRTFVKNKDTEYQRYEGIMAWHPQKKKLFDISFAFDGALSEYLIDMKDPDTFQLGWTPFNESEPGHVRQTIKFLDADTFLWSVWVKRGDDWNQIIEDKWHRKSK